MFTFIGILNLILNESHLTVHHWKNKYEKVKTKIMMPF